MNVTFKHYSRNQLRLLRQKIDSALESPYDDFSVTISVEDVYHNFSVLDCENSSSSVEAN